MRPVAGSFLTPLGFRGDAQRDPEAALLIACSEQQAANVIVRGLDCTRLRPRQRYRLGGAFIELTRPGDAGAYYARVVMPGHVRVNDNIELIDAAA
jgi:MOSC domain-containing protein YiiM